MTAFDSKPASSIDAAPARATHGRVCEPTRNPFATFLSIQRATIRTWWVANSVTVSRSGRVAANVVVAALVFSGAAQAQLSVSAGGAPTYNQSLAVPPGIAGLSPKLGLSYSGGGVDGPVGYGWSVQGVSMIVRCPSTIATDGQMAGVAFGADDKLCLDGQRLIQIAANGTALTGMGTNDAAGLGAGAYHEYRTELDTYARIRAYGFANNDVTGASGPAFFKVWTKAGQIYEYGDGPSKDANTKALISVQGKSVAMVWAVARISDVSGNFIDYKYEQRNVAWGSGPTAGSPTLGQEWNLLGACRA